MSKSLIAMMVVFSILLFSSGSLYAGGLSTYFVEVKLENLEPGSLYSVKEVTGETLVLINETEDVTTDIAVTVEKPVDYNLVPGYEPILDLSWIIIEKGYFVDVGPGEQAETDILIMIPEGEEHYGKKYQVYIYSHTAGKATTFRMGLMSRILLHISPEPSGD